jgi:predicted phosphodiesterase
MGRVALISDIHGNHVALDAVLADIATQSVEAVYCLGDIVGYGPMPIECMRTVFKTCRREHMIMGNHDHAVIHEPVGFNKSARMAALWTNKVAKPGMLHFFGNKRLHWSLLCGLPTVMNSRDGDVIYVHASPRQHLEEYILEELTKGISMTGEDPEQMLRANFALVKHTCFVGHTHRPGVITGDDHKWHSLTEMDYHWTIDPRKTLINIGSVGQPRDGDPRACYVLWDGAEVIWRRVDYDIEKTRAQIRAIPSLEDRLGDRLLEGR